MQVLTAMEKIKSDLIAAIDNATTAKRDLEDARELAAAANGKKCEAESVYRAAVVSLRTALAQCSRVLEAGEVQMMPVRASGGPGGSA